MISPSIFSKPAGSSYLPTSPRTLCSFMAAEISGSFTSAARPSRFFPFR